MPIKTILGSPLALIGGAKIYMKPVFPSYIIKRRAKAALKGRVFKAFAIAVLPSAVVVLLSALMFWFMPGVKESFELAVSGSFSSLEARETYLSSIMDNCMWATNLLLALFSFLTVGSAKLCLDMVRGKDVKVRDIFCFYDKWYIAAIYPALNLIVSFLWSKLYSVLEAGIPQAVLSVVALAVDVAILVVGFKLMFIDYALADNDCKSFIRAVKTSWHLVGFNTVLNSVMLTFSFLGWAFFSAVTCGIAAIYMLPYFNLAAATLYEANKRYNTDTIKTNSYQ